MEKIASFTVNHLKLKKGLYISRVDGVGEEKATTFDLRFTVPNKEKAITPKALHTIEHLGATFFRNSEIANKVIYFGPMGCRTGFYLVLFGKLTPQDIYGYVVDMLDYVINFKGQIPGATAIECGNYKEQDLKGAKKFALKYKEDLIKYKNFVYED